MTMGVIKSLSNVWTGLRTVGSMADGSESKRWDDDLLAIRNGNMETWNLSGGVKNPYASNYTVQRGISLLATNIAQVPLDIYKGDTKLGPEFEFNQVLKKPNEYTSRFELWEQTMIYFYLYGEAFWFLNTNNFGIIREIYTLHPKFMKHVQEKEGTPITGWIYNDNVPMPLEQVIHIKLFSTTGERGLSPLDSVKVEYEADAEAAKYNRNFFINGSRPSGMISLDRELSTTVDEMERVLSMFKRDHRGSSNAYKVGILSPGMKYEEMGQTMRDMEYLDGRDAIRDRILMVLGIHKAVVGVTDKIDRATADVALRSLWQTNLKPNTVRIQEKLNAELFSLYYPGLECRFDLTVVEELKKDLNSSLDAATKYFMMGYSRNEINTRLGLEMPDDTEYGDTKYVPINLAPINDEPLVAPTNPDKAVQPIEKKVKAGNPHRKRFLAVQGAQERAFNKKLKSFMTLQRGKVLKTIVKSKSDGHEVVAKITLKIQDIFDKENARLEKAMLPYYRQTAEAGAELAYETLGLEKEALIDNTVLLQRTNKLKGINQTVFNQIKMEIAEGVKAKESINQITTRVKGVYEFFNDSQAEKIARTETSSLVSQSSLKVYQEEGVTRKEWLHSNDKRVRDSHGENGAEGPIPVGQAFSGTGEQYPGEKEINCRCALAPVVD